MERSVTVGRAFDWESKSCKFESHPQQSHCVVFFSKTLYPLLNTGSTQEYMSLHDFKVVDWDKIKSNKKEKKYVSTISYIHLTTLISVHI